MKQNDLTTAIDELIRCAQALTDAAKALRKNTENPLPAAAAEAEPPARETIPATPPAKEEVRLILARKAAENGGKHKTQVKALVQKYGNGGSLTDVNPKDYADLIKEAEGLADA